MLLLVWRSEGKRHYLYLGVPDSPTNRTVAAKKAAQIQLDMASENFDPTLKHYRPVKGSESTVAEMMSMVIAEKINLVENSCWARYSSLDLAGSGKVSNNSLMHNHSFYN
ncbi:MAG: DUF3596 domain-containing protein [Oscillatoriales cyanobacterium RM2_1_1]|nr:DUF3596 domain-containing protein [Oscillatoriales cyanobacterium SM2_3_0]NJO45837.1 DUF3596 domain-containing protein [Oscillatoriales cyanobacterium RM2_1_1]